MGELFPPYAMRMHALFEVDPRHNYNYNTLRLTCVGLALLTHAIICDFEPL